MSRGLRLMLIIALAAAIGFLTYLYVVRPYVMRKMCTDVGGTWNRANDICDLGEFISDELPGDEPLVYSLNDIVITIPDTQTTAALLKVTSGSKESYTATFNAGGPTDGTVTLIDTYRASDSKSRDVFIPFAVNQGGSGTFVYLGLFAVEGQTLIHKDSYFVGDRVSVESVSLNKDIAGKVTLRYKDRKAGEPMSTPPSISHNVSIGYADHAFSEKPMTTGGTQTYKDLVRLDSPLSGATVSSPLSVKGAARGNWFFEASFPIIVTDWDGLIIGQGIATAQGEWMTTNYVPFEASITYTLPANTPYKRGTLILKKDNPSGLPEHDDAFEIPINFN